MATLMLTADTLSRGGLAVRLLDFSVPKDAGQRGAVRAVVDDQRQAAAGDQPLGLGLVAATATIRYTLDRQQLAELIGAGDQVNESRRHAWLIVCR